MSLSTLLRGLEDLAVDMGIATIQTSSRALRERYAAQEWLVVVLGETSSGKSTWVNSLLGRQILPATPGATTGTPVEIRFAAREAALYEGVLPDGRRDVLDLAEFQVRCLQPAPYERLRVLWPLAWLPPTLSASLAAIQGLVLVDAPGYNSCVAEHQEILTTVLPEADAVVSMLNYTRGYTPEDGAFLELVRGQVEVPLLFAVNWAPADGGGRKVGVMREAIAQNLRLSEPLIFPLTSSKEDGIRRIWSDALWQGLEALAHSPERQRLIEAHVLALTENLLGRLWQELEARAMVAEAEEAQLLPLREAIEQYKRLRTQALALVDHAETAMMTGIEHVCNRMRDSMWADAKQAVGEANRFMDADGCSAFIKNSLLPRGFRALQDDLDDHLRTCTRDLGERIEELATEIERVELPPIHLRGPQWEALSRKFASRAARSAAEFLFVKKLGEMGGAAGSKAGFVNLAKHLVSKGGRLFGKTFSREFYNGMGAMLRQIGLRAGVATSAIGAAVAEAAAYLYHVVRWPDKLLALVQRALGLPATYEPFEDVLLRQIPFLNDEHPAPLPQFKEDAAAAVRETLMHTRAIVADNFGARAEVLEEALEAREACGTQDPAELEAARERVAELMKQLNALQGGMVHG